jgi:hypothetical protein
MNQSPFSARWFSKPTLAGSVFAIAFDIGPGIAGRQLKR